MVESVDSGGHRSRYRGIRLVASITVVVLVAGVAVALEGQRPRRAATTSSAPPVGAPELSLETVGSGPLQIRVVLDESVVHGGSSIKGEVVFVNTATAPVPVYACPDDWLMVGLTKPGTSFEPPDSLSLCAGPGLALAPGVSTFSISVPATYSACTYPNLGYAASPQIPFCTGAATPPSQVPPLPPGQYEAKAFMHGLPAGTASPAAVPVSVVP